MKPVFFQLASEKRAAIVTAAIVEFGRNDFAAASLDRIVNAAGISKGGLYEYIASKEELYRYCMETAWGGLYAHIRARLGDDSAALPADILERFLTVSRVAIDWYLANPDSLGLIVRIARLPRDALAAKAQGVFESHFAQVFAGLDGGRLAYPLAQLIELVQWLLAKTRKDVLLEIEAGRPADEVRRTYLAEWEFFCAVLRSGIYLRD